MWSNFHTHSDYCDGKGALKDYLDAARKAGVGHIGFSSHAPVPFPCKWCMKANAMADYLQEIESLKKAFPEVEIYKGLEIDFVPEFVSPRDFKARLDFTIGSIHFVDSFEGNHWEIDSSLHVFKSGLQGIFKNNVQSAVTRYFELTREMILTAHPDILGHLDKIKIHNSEETLFEESEPWYRNEIDKTVKTLRETKIIVEVNTRGIYKKKSATTYPSPWILERICQSHIPVTLSSDAHHPDDLTREFGSAVSLLKDIGFKNLSILQRGIWKAMPFNQYGIDG